jgi:cysteine synthase A
MPQQFDNPANVEVHRRTTADEILRDFADQPLDAIITGVGTGGHITACAEVLKPKWPGLKVFAVEPALSPILSGGAPGPHPIQGLGANFVPSILNTGILDGIIDVDANEAKEMARRCAREEGLLGQGAVQPWRDLVRGSAGRRGAEAAGARREATRAHLQLRHWRAVSVGA